MKPAFYLSLLGILTLATFCAAAAAQKRDLILVAGQPNAVGFDASASELPADARDKDVLFWWRRGDPPPDDHDSTSRGWTTLQPQPIPCRKRPGSRASMGVSRSRTAGSDRRWGLPGRCWRGSESRWRW